MLILIACSEPFDMDTEKVIDNESSDHQIHKNDKNEFLCTFAEELPQYPGGIKKLYKYINENIQWPDSQSCVEGKVFVSFVVECDGSITNIEVVRGRSRDYDKAALKVFQNMPKWDPAKQRGQPVRAKMMIPITFCL